MYVIADLILGVLETAGFVGRLRGRSDSIDRVVPSVTAWDRDRPGKGIPVEIAWLDGKLFFLVTDGDIPSRRDLNLHLEKGSDRIEVQPADSHRKAEVMRALPRSRRSRRNWSRMTDADLRTESRSLAIYEVTSDVSQIRSWLGD